MKLADATLGKTVHGPELTMSDMKGQVVLLTHWGAHCGTCVALLPEWQALYKPDIDGIRIIGFQWSPKSHRLKEFLSGNLIPFLWMDAENNKGAEKYLESANVTRDDLPLVILKDGSFIIDPALPDLAARVGLQQTAIEKIYDVLIIGGGPAATANFF